MGTFGVFLELFLKPCETFGLLGLPFWQVLVDLGVPGAPFGSLFVASGGLGLHFCTFGSPLGPRRGPKLDLADVITLSRVQDMD